MESTASILARVYMGIKPTTGLGRSQAHIPYGTVVRSPDMAAGPPHFVRGMWLGGDRVLLFSTGEVADTLGNFWEIDPSAGAPK